MAHVSKSMLGRQANSHLKSSPSFGFGTEERAKASSAKSGGLTASPGPVYYPLSTTYNSYPKSPSHSFGAAHRYTKVNSAASSHRTARTGRGDTVPQACSHERAALGAPQLALLASLGDMPRPDLLPHLSEKPPSHSTTTFALPPPRLVSQALSGRLAAPPPSAHTQTQTDRQIHMCFRSPHRSWPRSGEGTPCARYRPRYPLPTTHGPSAQSLTHGPATSSAACHWTTPRSPGVNPCRGWHVPLHSRWLCLPQVPGPGMYHSPSAVSAQKSSEKHSYASWGFGTSTRADQVMPP